MLLVVYLLSVESKQSVAYFNFESIVLTMSYGRAGLRRITL